MFKGTPRQFIFMNTISQQIIVVGYAVAESMVETLKNWVYIGEV
jgi:hypothetical protein